MNRPPSPAPDEIQAARKDAGLDQAAAAALIYRSYQCWGKWERGERDMDPALWEYWCIRARVTSPDSRIAG